ncbi:MAG: pantoate--beta-alanine ligase [bacterium]|nr:pantoate--beta-alanine ligase [bacterium]
MLQVDSLDLWRHERAGLADRSLGFVPTMGALHDGHASLVERSVRENDVTVVSVFVNPAQFDQPDDLAHYPRTLDADRRLAEKLGVDYLLCPRGREIYPDGYAYKVVESPFSRQLCGAHRAGHFDGVLTVVLKLLNLTRPQRAYFGEKDFQQFELVRGMVDAFLLEVEIIACPTVREPDGLAASSRNRHLKPPERELAREFPRLLSSPGRPEDIVRQLEARGFVVDYVDELRGRRFGAVRLGEVRLIDNVALASVQTGGNP